MFAIIRFSVFLLTIGTGFLIGSFELVSNKSMKPPEHPKVGASEIRALAGADEKSDEFVNDEENRLEEIKFVCKDEAIRPIWIALLREMGEDFFNSKLQKEYDCSKFLRIREIDLNDDGKSEYSVSVRYIGVCSATANCPVAIYGVFDDERSRMQTTAGVYDFSLGKLLFSKGIIGYQTETTRSQGFQDLLLRHNGSSYNDNLFLYKFDGDQYKLKLCFEEDKGTERRTKIDCRLFDTPIAPN